MPWLRRSPWPPLLLAGATVGAAIAGDWLLAALLGAALLLLLLTRGGTGDGGE